MTGNNGKAKAPTWAGKQDGSKKARLDEPGLALERRLTQEGGQPARPGHLGKRDSMITNPDGSVVFKMKGVEIPEGWSQLATDIVVSKYFRKAGIHGDSGSETSVAPGRLPHRAHHPRGRRAARRLLRARRRTPTRSRPSSRYLLVHQYGAFNSPVWFNCGLCHAYGIDGSGGNWAWDENASDGRSSRRRTPTSARSARRASSRASTTT